MDFNGGVIIIGSLLWDDSPLRTKWRDTNLAANNKGFHVSMKIRYGRRAGTRHNTYTMIFNNHPETRHGKAFVIPFIEPVKNFNYLEKQAFSMALAEGLCKTDKNSLHNGWGAVGLLMNPKIDSKDKKNAYLIRERWSKLYTNYPVREIDYSIDNETPVIDKNGFFQINWNKDINRYDFLIGTAIVPLPHRLLTAKEIAENFIENNYRTYFDNNCKCGINTFQDEEIRESLATLIGAKKI